jgi:hypothetical protein
MQSVNQIQLYDDEYEMAVSILRMVKPNLTDADIDVAYCQARHLVETIKFDSSVTAISVWCSLTHCGVDELILIAIGKEIAQIVAGIDAKDSLADFFGWLIVAKMHGVDVKNILDTLNYRIYINKNAW